MNTHVPVGPLSVPTLPACSPSVERGRGGRPGRKGLPTMTPPGLAGSPREVGHRGKRPQGTEDSASWPPLCVDVSDGSWLPVTTQSTSGQDATGWTSLCTYTCIQIEQS